MEHQSSTPNDFPVGTHVTTLRRVLFCHGATVQGDEGPIELGFSDGLTLLFECGASGEDLTVSRGPWIDPFEEPLSPENTEFVMRSGKWEAFDLGSHLWSYRRLVGRVLTAATPMGSSGVRLVLEDSAVDITAVADELRVQFVELSAAG